MGFIKKHPYLVGGLVFLVVIYFVLRGKGSSSSGGSTTVVQSGPSDSVQAAQIAAGANIQALNAATDQQANGLAAALAGKQLDDTVALQTAGYARDVALQNTYSQTQIAMGQFGSAVSVAQAQADAGVAVASIGANRDVAVAGTQAQVQAAGIQYAYKTQQDIDATASYITDSNNYTSRVNTAGNAYRDITVNQSNNDAAVATAKTYTGGAVDISKIQAGVATHGIDAETAIELSGQQYAYAIGTQAISAQRNATDQLFANLSAGTFNKGGQGGANNVSALNTMFGSPVVSQSVQNTATTDASKNGLSGIITSIGGAVGNAASGLFGGKGVASVT